MTTLCACGCNQPLPNNYTARQFLYGHRLNKEPRKCLNCGNEFIESYTKKLYCSKICANRAKVGLAVAAIVPGKERIIIQQAFCQCGCGQPLVTKTKWDYRRNQPRTFLPHHGTKKEKVKLVCAGCGKDYYLVPNLAKRSKYCSRKCSDGAERPRGRTREDVKALWAERMCPVCNTIYPLRQRDFDRGRRLTCSRKCGQRLTSRIKGKRANISTVAQRVRVLSSRPHVCEKCGFTPLHIGVLTIHHKDGNRRNGEDGNLELLCWNCHITEHALSGTAMFKPSRRPRLLTINNT